MRIAYSKLSEARLGRLLCILFVCVLGGGLGFFALYTLHWPMMVNAPVMHYVNFLMSHGLRPYKEITDMNMPGAYLLERFGMTVFGPGDLGWRLYDYFLALALMAAATVIAKPHGWLAGVFTGGIFALRHGAEGPWFSGEREEEMAVLLAVSCALLFLSERHRRPVLACGFGFMAGMAASIKPTLAPFVLCAPLILAVALKRRGVRPDRYIAWALGGLILAAAISVGFLFRFHAWGGLLFVLRSVAPLYRTLDNPGRGLLLKYALPIEWLPLLALAAVAVVLERRWDWERLVLLLGAGCGLLSYMVQGKGFWYQRYTILVFALLLISLELFSGGNVRPRRWLGYAALIYATVYLVPRYTRSLSLLPQKSELTVAMESDLEHLGVARLQRQVQCFDMTFGCLNSLYHLDLVENTGFTGDMLLFPEKPSPSSAYYQNLFWQTQAQHPAGVIVFTNQDFSGPGNSYTRLERWPSFSEYLAQHYTEVASRSFPREDRYATQAPAPPEHAPSYRIYVRKDFPTAITDSNGTKGFAGLPYNGSKQSKAGTGI